MSNSEPTQRERRVLAKVLQWSRARGYRGHSKHDALNSPLLNALSLNLKLPRLVITQVIMRFPVNLRPLLGVPHRRNPKGIGLFAHAWFDLASVIEATPDAIPGLTREDCLSEGERLLSWLVHNASPWAQPSKPLREAFHSDPSESEIPDAPPEGSRENLSGMGWGYHYPWQDAGFFQKKHFPNRVVSCWIGFAFLRAYAETGEERYLAVAREVAAFLLENPNDIVITDDQRCLSYVPLPEVTWAVMDVSALVAALCANLALHEQAAGGNAAGLLSEAKRLIHFVVDKQTSYGAWFYTWPSGDSHIRHDNYHTGIILDCLADYMTFSGDYAYEQPYCSGLDYYRQKLFLASGAPRWMNDRTFPHDVHGAAAGILAFTRAAEYFALHGPRPDGELAAVAREFAARIATWTLDTLYDRRGFFRYQKTRCMTKRFCLMRWCNAWMCRAVARSLLLPQGNPADVPAR